MNKTGESNPFAEGEKVVATAVTHVAVDETDTLRPLGLDRAKFTFDNPVKFRTATTHWAHKAGTNFYCLQILIQPQIVIVLHKF